MLTQMTIIPSLNFLSGGGNMGELVRSMDWSATSVGNPAGWPQSLRTSVSICLNSNSPLLIWWGKDLVKIYNDAYRDLIDTKHPKAMGANGADVWPEILPNVLPMLKGILTDGEATVSEDQLLIIERNGRSEVCYFTFSYSAIRDETGNVGGIFCAVHETTKKVNAERKFSTLLNNLFIQAPVAICILRGENYIVEVVNKMMLEFWGRNQNEVLNKPVFEALPEVNGQGFKEILDAVYKQGERFVAEEIPVNLMRRGKMENAFMKVTFKAEDLIENYSNNQIFLNRAKIYEMNLNLHDVQQAIVNEIIAYQHIDKAYTGMSMTKASFTTGIEELVQNGYNQKRSGDVIYVYDPSVLSYSLTGSSHGTSFNYDTHVPLLLFGKGIKNGKTLIKTRITDIAPTMSAILGISFPNGATGQPLEFVLE